MVLLALGMKLACASTVAADLPAPPLNPTAVLRTETSAFVRWTPGAGTAQGFKIRPSLVPGVHPNPETYPAGHLAAFTWCVDDGYHDTLLYEPSFSSRGLHFTAFVPASVVGNLGRVSWSDLVALHQAGHEVANHTMTHTALIDDRAIALRYLPAGPCVLSIAGKELRTWANGEPDLHLFLDDPSIFHMGTLAAALDAEPDYEATLLFSPDTIFATRSQSLNDLAGKQIGFGAAAETLTSKHGVHNVGELRAQVLDAQTLLEQNLTLADSTFKCRTLSFPNHAHTQWAMTHLNEMGYLGARSGGMGPMPYFSTGNPQMGLATTYQVPLTWPSLSNTWSEATTRSTYASRVAEWKANREWAVFLAHTVEDADVLHVEWLVDTVASDPDVWVARFDEVLEFFQDYWTDVGLPIESSGTTAAAWVHGLDPTRDYPTVITAYNAFGEESDWSTEFIIPAHRESQVESPEAWATSDFRIAPNPFVQSTAIFFSLVGAGALQVDVFDLHGRRVRRLLKESAAVQSHEITWDGRDDNGQTMSTGVYWIRVMQGGQARTAGKVTLLR